MNCFSKSARIVHFSSVHLWYDTRIFRRICRSLAEAGYDVHLVAAADDRPFESLHDGVHVHTVPRAGGRVGRLVTTARAVIRKALELDGQLYHFHDPELVPFARRLVKTGRPVVYDAHEDLPQDLLGKDWLPPMIGHVLAKPLDWVERHGSARFAAVVAAEEAIESRFDGVVPYTLTIHNYPSMLDFPETLWNRPRKIPPTIVHFGGLSQLRAIEPLVDAIGLLPPALQARLLLAGRCESHAMMERLQAKPGYRRAEYLGWLSHDAMRAHLAESTIAINLFSDAPNNQRVRSNRFFESLATGVPVITSDLPAWKAIVTELDCGLAVDAADPSAIASAITHLLAHPDEAEAMGARGRKAIVAKYNWEAEFQKLLRLYQQLLKSA